MLRAVLMLPAGVALALLLFYILASISGVGSHVAVTKTSLPELDLFLLRPEPELEIRKRQLPPEPEDMKPQAPPDMPPLTADKIPLDIPELALTTPDVQPEIDLAIDTMVLPEPAPAPAKVLPVPTPAPVAPLPTPTPLSKSAPVTQVKPVLATGKWVFNPNPSVLNRIAPKYPSRALRRKIQGHVEVEFLVSESGRVQPDSIVVVESQPKGVFDKAVLKVIARWRFQPHRVDGHPVVFKARQKLQFKLEK